MAARERAGEEQRTEHGADQAEDRHRRRAVGAFAAQAPLGQRQRGGGERHDQEKRPALQKGIVGVAEMQLDVAGRQRAGDERGQERADTDRGRDPDPLEDVEDEVHRAVP